MTHAYKLIARVDKPLGSKGEVVCSALSGLPFLLSVGLEVWLVPPALDVERHHTVMAISGEGPSARVELSGLKSLDSAEAVRGCYVLVRQCDLPEDFWLYDIEGLLGLEVKDTQHGTLGAITQIMKGPANDVWVVEGPYGEVLVPVVEDFIVSATPDGVLMRLPAGFVNQEEP